MALLFINNFSVETVSTFAADEGYVLPIPSAALAQLDALMSDPDDYIILTVTAADQESREIVRYQPLNNVLQFPILRGYEGTTAVEWPAGSLISCNITASTMLRLAESMRLTRESYEQTLNLWGQSGVAWAPQDEYPYLELNLDGLSMGRGSPPVDITIDLQVWDGSVPTLLRIPSGVLVRYPEGTTWEPVPDTGWVVLTLQPATASGGWYRLQLAGVNNLTLDISDYSGYVNTWQDVE